MSDNDTRTVRIVKGDWKGYAGTVIKTEAGILTVAILNPPALFNGHVEVTVRQSSVI